MAASVTLRVDHAPSHGLLQGLVKYDVGLVDRGGGEAGVEAVAVESLHVGGGEGLELHPPDDGLDVEPHDLLVALVGRDPDRVPHAVREPPIQVLPERHLLVVENDPAVPVRHRLRELRRHFGPGLNRRKPFASVRQPCEPCSGPPSARPSACLSILLRSRASSPQDLLAGERVTVIMHQNSYITYSSFIYKMQHN